MSTNTRDYTIHRTSKTEAECQQTMRYPYQYIGYTNYQLRYTLDIIRKDILVETVEERAEAGDFPKNIENHFWARCGENDEKPWISCGQLTNGAYFFYTGSCDYTGFDCQGGMCLWVSKSWKNIVDHAMTEQNYKDYLLADFPEIVDIVDEGGKPDDFLYCCECGYEEGTMPDDFDENKKWCADCFWEADAERKRKYRSDPEWRYNRAFSAAKVLFNKSDEEAHAMAAASVAAMKTDK